MTLHRLKTWVEPFEAMLRGNKTFEFRRDDRGGFNVGDTLVLLEWGPWPERYTGRVLRAEVTYVLRGPAFGIPEGFAVMSVRVREYALAGGNRGE